MTTQSDVYVKNISVELCNNLPGFGAYMMHESDPDAPAVVLLNLRVAVEAAKAMRDGTEQVKLCISETLTHELLHVVQDIVGASVTEEEVHNALAQATGDVEVYDSDDEAREALYNENTQLRAELEQERAKVEALRALARSQHIKLNDLEEYFKEACGYHAAIVGCFETANAQCDFDKSVFGDVMRRYKKLFDTRQAVYLENSGCVEQAEARARELGAL